MSRLSRRALLRTGLGAVAGVSGLAVAERLAAAYGLVPPDGGGIYGPGETVTFAAHRLLVGDTPAREFPRSLISPRPFANELAPLGPAYDKLEAGGFADWRLEIGGLVERPLSLSVADLRGYAQHTHITQIACEEGWSYVAEWTGARLADVLNAAGVRSSARYVFYHSLEPYWSDSIDIREATHPQTLVALRMNGNNLSREFGGPMRIRVPRQLGYKSVKFVTRIDVVDSVKYDSSYAWYAGI